MLIAALIRELADRTRICRALGAADEIAFCADGASLAASLRSRHPDAVVLELRDGSEQALASLVGAVRARLPSLPVLVFCSSATIGSGAARALLAAGGRGASDIVFGVNGDLRTGLCAALRRARSGDLATVATSALVSSLATDARSIVALCVDCDGRVPSVAELASMLNVATRTVGRRLARAGLPAPHVLIAWARLVSAARLLQDSSRSIADVAAKLGLRSPRTLRELSRRYAGLQPNELRTDEALAALLDAFAAALRLRYTPGPCPAVARRPIQPSTSPDGRRRSERVRT